MMTDIELVLQRSKKTKMRLELLDEGYTVLKQLEGVLISMSCDISSTSDIRRTATPVLYFPDAPAGNQLLNTLWMDKMVRASFGIYDEQEKVYRWFLLGSFIILSNSYTYNASTRQLQVSLVDMMSAATESGGAQIGYGTVIPEGQTIKGAFESTIAQFSPYKRFDVCEFEDTVPYDLETSTGQYPIDILHKLLNLFPYYEMFYSKEGVFTVRKIPMESSQPCVLSADDMRGLVISEAGEIAFSDIKNTTEIWGQELDAAYTCSSCAHSGNQYILYFGTDFEKLESSMTYSFTPDEDSLAGQTIKVQSFGPVQVYTQDGDGEYHDVEAGAMLAGKHYVVKYTELLENDTMTKRFVLMGESAIHAMCMEYNARPSDETIDYLKRTYNCDHIGIVVNPDSPFAVDHGAENGARGNGIIKQVLTGGDYDAIYTTELALERASYENWKKTRLKDAIQMTAVLVPWLDVSDKVEYTSLLTGETHQYVVQDISMNLAEGTMDLTLQRFYPYYPWLE